MCGSVRAAALLAVLVLSVLASLLIRGLQQFGTRTEGSDTTRDEKLRAALNQQLQARRDEILPLLPLDLRGSAQDLDLRGSAQDLDLQLETRLWSAGSLDCGSLVDTRAQEVLGSGYTKLVVKVTLAGGEPAALKLVHEQGIDMSKCVQDFMDLQGCRELVSLKLRKEMVLIQRLQHPNVIQLKGHCSDGHRVTVILEQGSPVQMIQLLQSPWEDRFRVCLDLARLLHFLSRSPLGSVALLDFQPRQFVTVSGSLKLTDLDDASAGEKACATDDDCELRFPNRNFSLTCSQHRCRGLNEKMNVYNAYRYFFTYLLPHQAPPTLTHLVEQIMNSTAELKGDIEKTLEVFERILLLYQSGLHLDHLPPSLTEDYEVIPGKTTSGDTDYHCWTSYSRHGCVLSVHSENEAANICNLHSQCSSFSISQQTTWTGRRLASFRSDFTHLVSHEASQVYVRKAAARG